MAVWAPRCVRGVRGSGRTADGNAEAPRGGGRPRLQALAAAAKEEQPETHGAPQPSRAVPDARSRISMRDPGDKAGKECRIPLRGGGGEASARQFTNHGCGW
ncbi:hypothetical protein GCM10018772_03130 [Streptomyces fumanus]|uniref:Uncharacterized protein n=1 Tax=Streptomyces fumanus TaxID=67302 RepID=A0A919A1Z4_9ACTN|nr:hypothetical protein GCM10018772_03130 [Streptomyces fumanus]